MFAQTMDKFPTYDDKEKNKNLFRRYLIWLMADMVPDLL